MNGTTDVVTPAARTLRDKTGAPFEVRELSPKDRDQLQAFYEDFEPKRAAQGLPPGEPGRIRSWLTTIIATGLHLVALRAGQLIGHAFVVPTKRDGIGEYAVFLREDVRGRGVGTELNRATVDAARRTGWTGLWLSVEPRNRPAIRSYEKAGFRFIPETVYSIEPEMKVDLG